MNQDNQAPADNKKPVPTYPTPTIGRTVIYRLSGYDVEQIMAHRNDRKNSARGNTPHEGQPLPMIITAVHGSDQRAYVNGKVLLDGTDTYWATLVWCRETANHFNASGGGTWSWPERG